MGQSLPNWRLLLIDDGSTDHSLEIARSFADSRIEVQSDGRGLGISNRLNAAVTQTVTPYLCRMDADDVAYPKRLARQVATLEENPDIDLVATSVLVFSTRSGPLGVLRVAPSHSTIAASPWRGLIFPHPSWMGRTGFFRRYPYRPGYDGAEDQALLYEACRESRFLGIDEILLGYREDHRPLRKLFQRRLAFWRAVTALGSARGDMMDVMLLSLLQPIRIVGDAVRVYFGASWAGHRRAPISADIEAEWGDVRRRFAVAPVGGQ